MSSKIGGGNGTSRRPRGRPRKRGLSKTLESASAIKKRRAMETDEQRQLRLERQREAQQKLRQERLHAHQLQLSVNGLLTTASSKHHNKFPVKVCQEICQELYEIIRNHKTGESHLLCESFIRAPTRWSLPDYYEVVTSPMDLLKIKQKLKTGEYVDIERFASDIELMVNNAKNYYKESSIEYQDACELWNAFSDAKICKEKEKSSEIDKAATLGEFSEKRKSHQLSKRSKQFLRDLKKSSTLVQAIEGAIDIENESEPEDAQSNPQWLLYDTVKHFVDSDEFKLSKLFWKLPPERYYKDYYKEIKEPISLRIIGKKIKKDKYSCFSKVVADMKLMFKYTKMYNMDDPKLFKAAVILEKVMEDKAKELMKDIKADDEKRALKQNKRTCVNFSRIQESTLKRNDNLHACLWDKCDQRFQFHRDLVYHLTNDPSGHVRRTCKSSGLNKFKCLWYGCKRTKKKYPPFRAVYSIIHHVKTAHLTISNNFPEDQAKKEVLAAITCVQPDPFTLDVKTFLPIVTQPTADYVFQGKCKKCNFSDMMVSAETTDGCNSGIVLKCMLCPTTKVIGMEDSSIQNARLRSQAPIIDLPQITSIQQELILPDDGMNPSFLNSSLEPTRAKMQFNADQDDSTTESQSVPSGTYAAMDSTDFLQETSIKKELILPEDGTSLSVLNSSPELSRVEKKFCVNQDVNTSKLSEPPDTKTPMNVTKSITITPNAVAHTQTSLQRSSGHLCPSAAMDATETYGITPVDVLQVDLNLVKKEVED